ncbi:MAG: hypothetical protein HC845_03765 [Akkermansiaceae bacterium]|nr:hypothetical protein [Akkermansiaceae bacterium]
MDNVLIDTIAPPNQNYVDYVTSSVALGTGDRILRLESTNPNGGDNTVFIDDLTIESVSAAENWSNPATWGGTVPAALSDIEIPAGKTVVVDQNIVVDSLVVRGTLRFARQDLVVQACSIIADGPTARVEIGSETSRFTNNLTITLTGGVCTSPTACTCTTTGHEMIDGNVIASINGGVVDIHGAETVSWTKLNATAAAGSNTLTLAQPVTWPVGAKILVAASSTDWNESETRTIQSRSSDGLTLTLNSPLTYQHIGVQQTHTRTSPARTWNLDLRAEVGLLSRNVTIQGAADTESPGVNQGFGGHVMIMKGNSTLAGASGFIPGGRGYIEGAAFFRMGRKSTKGRYPLHFHMLGEEGKGQYFRNNSVDRSFNRALVIHGTEFTRVEGNACYDHIGHGFMLEDGSERFNRIYSNLLALSRRPASLAEAVTPSDFTGNAVQRVSPANYWLTNPNNIFENNVAAGTQGTGIWQLFPRYVVGQSASDPRFSNHDPSQEPLGSNTGNIAHSCRTGLDVSDGLTPDHDIIPNLGTQFPGGIVVENSTLLANYLGVYTGLTDFSSPSLLTFRSFQMADNAHHFMMAQNSLTEDTLAVANSNLGLFKNPTDRVNPPGILRAFHRSYDGPANFKNVHLVGFDAADSTIFSNNGASFKHTNALFEKITFNHPGTPKSFLYNYSIRDGGNGPQHYENPRDWMMVLRDVDGSVAGLANSSIIANNPFMRTSSDFQPANWVNTYRSPYKFAYTTLTAPSAYDPIITDMTVTRERDNQPPVSMYYSHLFDVQVELPLIVNDSYYYTYKFHTIPQGNRFILGIGDVAVNDFIKTRFRDVGNYPGIRVEHDVNNALLSQASSKAALDNATVSTYYRDTSNGDLWVKFFNQTTVAHQTTRVFVRWNSNGALSTVDTDGDGMGDYAEALGTGDYVTGVRDPMRSNDLSFPFNTNGNLAGWAPTGTTSSATVTGGELVVAASGGDPQMTRTGFNFKASDNLVMFVRYRSNAGGNLQIFWADETGPISAAQSATAASYVANSGYRTAIFNLANNPEWVGRTITQLRLDTLAGAGTTTWIDSIDFGTSDSDGDGRSNAFEVLTGNNPENANDLRFEFNKDNDYLRLGSVRHRRNFRCRRNHDRSC